MRVLFIVPYPTDEAPSQRFRFEQFYTSLNNQGIDFDTHSFIDVKTWRALYKPGKYLFKAYGILRGFLRRCLLMFRLSNYQYVFIHREAAPVGPPVFEWIISRVWNKKIIYDFDDAIWLPNVSESNKFISILKCYGKVASICKWSYKVSCGNDYLADFSRKYNASTYVIPTFVNTDYYKRTVHNSGTLTLGWTGSVSTNKYIEEMADVLLEVQKQTGCHILCISNVPPALAIDYEFIQWNKQNEVNDLQRIDIGIMPLPDDEWSKGKCGFKLIQYLSVETPAVASPIGVNPQIIIPGETGYLCNTKQEWIEKLILLCTNKSMRERMGEKGRALIVAKYSKHALQDKFLQLFS
jgi:glycosyltransferase involved in cell wall biosynthesis